MTTRPRSSSCTPTLLEAEPVGVGHAADGDQHHVGLDRLRRRRRRPARPCALSAAPALSTAVTLDDELERRCPASRGCAGTAGRPRRPCRAGCGRGTRPPSPRAPSRRHTEPSSSPITPAPTTSSRFGTLSSTSAPVEDTMRFSSMVDARQRRHVRAGGDDDRLGLERLRLAVGGR